MKISIAFTAVSIILTLILGYSIDYSLELRKENKALKASIDRYDTSRQEAVIDTIYTEVIRERDTLITRYQIYKNNKHNSVQESSISKSYLDSVAMALDVGNKAIKKLKKLNANLEQKIKKKDLTISGLEKEKWHWKNDRAEVYADLTDSTASVKYNADIAITDFSKRRNWFSAKEYYTAISTNDPNLKINGYQSYEHKTDVRCSKIGLGGYMGYGVQINEGLIKIGPQVGIGFTYNIF